MRTIAKKQGSKPPEQKSQGKQIVSKPPMGSSWTKPQREAFAAVWGILGAHYTLDDIAEWTGNTKSPGWWSHIKHGHFDQVRLTDAEHNSICSAWFAIQRESGKMPGLIKRELELNAAVGQVMQAKDELVKYVARYGRS